VFRFNNPEEVRKQRDRATMKSNLQLSVTAEQLAEGASTRPDSPVSSVGDNVDWTFAQREAALTKLGLDPTLDNLPDDDLNKLFEKISKVKTMRNHSLKSRPESSLSQLDDVWSDVGKPIPSEAATDDTSVDVPASLGTPEPDVSLKDVHNQLQTRIQAINGSAEAEDLIAEKEHMEHQLKLVQTQMKRMIEARARGETDHEAMAFEPTIYTARELRLIRKVLDKWRAHRSFSMAEVVLSHAVAVKEANIIRYVHM
jgi:kinesin family member 1